MDVTPSDPLPEHRPRRSRAAEAGLAAEMRRIASMTIEERIKAALSIGERFAWIAPVPADQRKEG